MKKTTLAGGYVPLPRKEYGCGRRSWTDEALCLMQAKADRAVLKGVYMGGEVLFSIQYKITVTPVEVWIWG